MVTKHQIKVIKSLGQKKYRHQLGLFTVEGVKGISEFLNSDFILDRLYTTQRVFDVSDAQVELISEKDLKRISSLKNPNIAVAVFKIKTPSPVSKDTLKIALDDVRDPGNLGTIIRLCDWYGIPDLICSLDTVDCYNSKVVQATMGSLTRVNVIYKDLKHYFSETNETVFGTFLEGENIYQTNLSKTGIVLLGNEANGISDGLKRYVKQKITIPQFGRIKETESLNVANATAIVLSEFLRRTIEM